MKIKSAKIPSGTLVNNYLPVDYSDVYVCNLSGFENISPDDVLLSFWTAMPKWVDSLFKLRNILVKPFGLKSGKKSKNVHIEDIIRNGESSEVMSVAQKSPDETVLLLTDKHLSAYLSVYIEDAEAGSKNVYATTLVNFHNKLGYIYFYTIYPFHHIVVKQLLKHTLNKLIPK